MKFIFFVSLLSVASISMATPPNKIKKNWPDHEFEVIPLNSPVKEDFARFKLVFPKNAQVKKVFYKIKNASKVKELSGPVGPGLEAPVNQNNEISVPIASKPPGHYRLFAWVKSSKGGQQHFKRRHSDFAKFIIDESLQVPVPDTTKNNATVGGVDSDNDGIRDDIQRYINVNYQDQNVRQAMKQVARARQESLLNSIDKAASIASGHKYAEAVRCLGWFLDANFVNETRKIESQLLDTSLRIKASLRNDQYAHGQSNPDSVLSLKPDTEWELCSFELKQE